MPSNRLIDPDPDQSATTNPPWKSGSAHTPGAFGSTGAQSAFGTCPTDAVHAVCPSLVIAATVPSFWNANTSATPVALGTAGTIRATPDPFPGFDHRVVPGASVPPGSTLGSHTVTSADAPPAVTVTCPTASAVSTGGSSADKLTTVASLVVHVNPVTACDPESNA